VTACCNSANCRYEADGRSFPCAGTNCTSAAEQVVDYCEDEYGGCAVAANGGEVTFSSPAGRTGEYGGGALAGLLALMFIRRRRQSARA